MQLAPRAASIAGSLIALGLLVAAVSPVAAAGLDQAEALYEEGDMAGAATLARSLGSAEGFALAARATLVQGAYLSPEIQKQALFERAATDAKEALALDPDQVDAHLELALALGHLAELEDPISAHVNGYAKEGKALLDQALALDPDNAWAQALLGIWHLRIVQRAGGALAKSLYGADRESGLELCSQAMGTAGEALALRYGCARALVDLDREAFAGEAERTLAEIKQTPARDVAEALAQAEADRLLAELKAAAPE